jgi:hypothetical protein
VHLLPAVLDAVQVTALEVVSPLASNPKRPTIAPLARTLSSLSVTEARVPSEAAAASSRTSAV